MSDNSDFIIERRLKELDPGLHGRFRDTVFVMQHTLWHFKRLFPDFNDHSMIHSLNVQEFCNKLIGPEQIDMLNADELYVLLMGCYLHDSGMSISDKDYEDFKDSLGAEKYFNQMPGRTRAEFVRDMHHEFSGCFIRKYADMLEIPTEEMLFAIVQVSRGHRRTNLFDEEEYPAAMDMGDGHTVCTPYLAALIRLADEIDVVADREPGMLYDLESITDERQIPYHLMLRAVPAMDVTPEGFLVHVDTDDDKIYVALEKMAEKMQDTLDLCRSVTEVRTPFRITQQWVRLDRA